MRTEEAKPNMHEMFTINKDLLKDQPLCDVISEATRDLADTLENVYGEEAAWEFIEKQGLEVSFKVIDYKEEMIDDYVISLSMKLRNKVAVLD